MLLYWRLWRETGALVFAIAFVSLLLIYLFTGLLWAQSRVVCWSCSRYHFSCVQLGFSLNDERCDNVTTRFSLYFIISNLERCWRSRFSDEAETTKEQQQIKHPQSMGVLHTRAVLCHASVARAWGCTQHDTLFSEESDQTLLQSTIDNMKVSLMANLPLLPFLMRHLRMFLLLLSRGETEHAFMSVIRCQ